MTQNHPAIGNLGPNAPVPRPGPYPADQGQAHQAVPMKNREPMDLPLPKTADFGLAGQPRAVIHSGKVIEMQYNMQTLKGVLNLVFKEKEHYSELVFEIVHYLNGCA